MPKVQSIAELRALYGAPHERALRKQIDFLDKHAKNIIQKSPFMVMATSGNDDLLDISPRGGDNGFVYIQDDHTLIIPDWPGNNRLDNLQNLIESPALSLVFFLPGMDETLRVQGLAEVRTDDHLLDLFTDKGRRPVTVTVLSTKEVYLHCAKAMMRSNLWDPDFHIDRKEFPSMGQMIKDQTGSSEQAESQEEMVHRYKTLLY